MTRLRSIGFKLNGGFATLKQIFQEPPPTDINWKKVKGLLTTFHVDIRPGVGNGTSLRLNQHRVDVHEPEFGMPPSTGTVMKIKNFLKEAGITPDTVWRLLRENVR